ncbi:MAG: RnfABCDGE type electron transport complex subunit D [Ruminococcus sp.]|nr:RnfABCDGE type electron transport complex subunit D [Ruminococcus sp.]
MFSSVEKSAKSAGEAALFEQSASGKKKLPRNNNNPVNNYNFDTIIIGIVLAATAVFYYGRRAFAILIVSVLCCVVLQVAVSLVTHKKVLSSIAPAFAVGLINAVILPVTVPFGAVAVSAAVSIILLRAAFGGNEHEVINPSAGALLFIFFAFPGKLNVFTNVFESLPVEIAVYPDSAVDSFFGSLINAGLTVGDYPELLAGRLPFIMGGCTLIIIAALIMYIIRRDISGIAFIFAAACFFGISYLVTDSLRAAIYALAGILPGMVLTALPVSARFSGTSAKLIYGIALGLVCSLFIWYSKNEYGGFFAAVILSPLSAYFANHEWNLKKLLPSRLRKMKLS